MGTGRQRVSGSLGWEWGAERKWVTLELCWISWLCSQVPPSNPSISAAPAKLLKSVLRTRSLSAAPPSRCLHLQNGITSENPARG